MNRSWPMIKVCGIRSKGDAETVLEKGANSIGLLIGLTHKAEDHVDEQTGKEIAELVRMKYPDARIVLVTHLLDPEEVKRIAENVGVTTIQVHGDMRVEDIRILRAQVPSVELIKTIHIEGGGASAAKNAIERARLYAPYVDALLTDSQGIDSDGQIRIGGTGRRHDADVGRLLVQAFPEVPVILAGGLNPGNVESAIQHIKPAGIDANSGLETLHGTKDGQKVQCFVEAGRKIPVFRFSSSQK